MREGYDGGEEVGKLREEKSEGIRVDVVMNMMKGGMCCVNVRKRGEDVEMC